MEIPSSQGGVVKEVKVKLGDMVKQGSVVLTLEAAGAAASAPVEAPKQASTHAAPAQDAPNKVALASAGPTPAPAPTAASFSGAADLDCELMVLGAGPGGYSAAFRAADLGLKVVLVERYAALGRLPECRLHPVESAAACRRRDGRGQPHGRARN